MSREKSSWMLLAASLCFAVLLSLLAGPSTKAVGALSALGPVQVTVVSVPAKPTKAQDNDTEPEGFWTYQKTEDGTKPEVVVTVTGHATAIKNPDADDKPLAKSFTAKASKSHEATHDASVVMDTHKVTVKPKSGGGALLRVHKGLDSASAEAQIVIKGQIKRTADDDVKIVWDGYANPFSNRVELKAGEKKHFDKDDQ